MGKLSKKKGCTSTAVYWEIKGKGAGGAWWSDDSIFYYYAEW